MFGFGFHLGFPDGRPRGDGSGAPVPRILTGTVDVDPTFSANLSTGIELEGTVQVNPLLWGGLDPLRILIGKVEVDPEFTANLQVTRALRGTIQVDPVFEADLEEVTGHMLAGTIQVDPVFEADMEAPPVLNPPEFIGISTSGSSGSGSFSFSYPTGTQEGDLAILIFETARQSPFSFTDPDWTLLYQNQVGTAGNVNSSQIAVWGKFVGSGAPNVAGSFSSCDHFYRTLLTFRGVEDNAAATMAARLAGALGSIYTAAGTSSGPQFSAPVTTRNKSMVVLAVAHGSDSSSPQTGFSDTGGLTSPTTQNNAGTTAGNGGGLGILTGTKDVAGTISPNPGFVISSSQPWAIIALEIYSVSPYQNETDDLLAAMTVKPDNDRKSLIDETIISLKTAGLWAKLDQLVVLAAHDEQAARINWKDPTRIAAIFGAPTFTADVGVNVDANEGYTFAAGQVPATNFTLNDCSAGVCLSAMGSAGRVLNIGTLSAGDPTIIDKSGTTFTTYLTDATGDNTTMTFAAGDVFTIMRRSAAPNTKRVYQNTTLRGSPTRAPTTLPTNANRLMHIFRSGSFDAATVMRWTYAGGAMTDSELGDLISIMAAYYAAL